MFPHDRKVPEELLEELTGIMIHAGVGESCRLQLTCSLVYHPPRRYDLTWFDIGLYWRSVATVHFLCGASRLRWRSWRLLRLCCWLEPLLILPRGYFDHPLRSLDGIFQ